MVRFIDEDEGFIEKLDEVLNMMEHLTDGEHDEAVKLLDHASAAFAERGDPNKM